MKLINALRPFSRRFQHSEEQKSFRGIGTVLVTDTSDLRLANDTVTPEQLACALNILCEAQARIICNHSGLVLQFIGDAVQAVWSEQRNGPEHAQLAFDAACEILREFEKGISTIDFVSLSIRICLSTGDMAGDFVQPINQFQVIGRAPNLAEELLATKFLAGSTILLSPETACRLKLGSPLSEVGCLKRENGEEIKVLAYG